MAARAAAASLARCSAICLPTRADISSAVVPKMWGSVRDRPSRLRPISSSLAAGREAWVGDGGGCEQVLKQLRGQAGRQASRSLHTPPSAGTHSHTATLPPSVKQQLL